MHKELFGEALICLNVVNISYTDIENALVLEHCSGKPCSSPGPPTPHIFFSHYILYTVWTLKTYCTFHISYRF